MPIAIDDRLDPDKIGVRLNTKRIGRRVVVYDRTSSTSDVAAEYARNPDNDGLVVFAEAQTAGRGRTGAAWHSGHGESLLFSVVLTDCTLANELLSLTCAVAVAGALGQVGGQPARTKWPNDILLTGRKVAGILVESKQTGAGQAHIVGVGINCHQTEATFPAEIRDTAVSLDQVGRTRCRRVPLARRVLASLDHWLAVATKDKRRVIDAWDQLSTQLGQRVIVSYNGRTFTGNCIGVDPEKGLVLQLDRGGVRMFDAAHTTILKQSPTGAPPL